MISSTAQNYLWTEEELKEEGITSLRKLYRSFDYPLTNTWKKDKLIRFIRAIQKHKLYGTKLPTELEDRKVRKEQTALNAAKKAGLEDHKGAIASQLKKNSSPKSATVEQQKIAELEKTIRRLQGARTTKNKKNTKKTAKRQFNNEEPVNDEESDNSEEFDNESDTESNNNEESDSDEESNNSEESDNESDNEPDNESDNDEESDNDCDEQESEEVADNDEEYENNQANFHPINDTVTVNKHVNWNGTNSPFVSTTISNKNSQAHSIASVPSNDGYPILEEETEVRICREAAILTQNQSVMFCATIRQTYRLVKTGRVTPKIVGTVASHIGIDPHTLKGGKGKIDMPEAQLVVNLFTLLTTGLASRSLIGACLIGWAKAERAEQAATRKRASADIETEQLHTKRNKSS